MKIKSSIKRYLLLARKARFMLLRNGYRRANYLRKHHFLAEIGNNVYFYSRIFPSDPELLKIHNNVVIATNVRFLGHDRIDMLMTGMLGERYYKYYDCIEIGNNVFIGSDVIILPGVKVGDNTIIGAGAVVTKDLEGGYIYGGVPAKRIGRFSDLIDKRKNTVHPENNPELLWEQFYKNREL